jgi:hypothetical protein
MLDPRRRQFITLLGGAAAGVAARGARAALGLTVPDKLLVAADRMM